MNRPSSPGQPWRRQITGDDARMNSVPLVEVVEHRVELGQSDRSLQRPLPGGQVLIADGHAQDRQRSDGQHGDPANLQREKSFPQPNA